MKFKRPRYLWDEIQKAALFKGWNSKGRIIYELSEMLAHREKSVAYCVNLIDWSRQKNFGHYA